MKLILTCCLSLLLSIAIAQSAVDAIVINPNPFFHRTSISYNNITNDTVTVEVYNISGQLIVTLFTNSVIPSSFNDSLIMDAFPPGVYLIHMQLGHRKAMVAKIVKTAPVRLVENKDIIPLRVYPNPSTGILYIEFPEITGRYTLSVIDIMGRELINEQVDPGLERKLCFSLKEKGVYTVSLKQEGRMVTKKVVVL